MPIAANSNPGMLKSLEATVSARRGRLAKLALLTFVAALACVVAFARPARAEGSGDVWWRINDTTLELSGVETSGYDKWEANTEVFSEAPWKEHSESITAVSVTGPLAPFSINGWFEEMGNITSANLKNLDLTYCVDMQKAFKQCKSLTSVDVSGKSFDAVENMSALFKGCTSLKTVDLRGCKAPKLEICSELFSGCTALASVDMSSFVAPSLSSANDMFSGCASLLTVNIQGLVPNGEVDTDFMFDGCDKIVGLTVGRGFAFDELLFLRDATWTSSADGRTYATANLPSNVAATYYIPGTAGEPAKPVAPVGRMPLERLYNPNSGEHFYTSEANERNTLVELGWVDEGLGWTAPTTSKTPVYRLYNEYAGEHHYTMDVGEREALVALGWNYEGLGWYSDDAKGAVLYRLYNPNEPANNHHYTPWESEREALVELGWTYEGTAWYGVA